MASKPQHRSAIQLSIIIVNYNVRDFLHHALVSLHLGLKGIRAEVFVVDNASDDGSVEMVKRHFPSVHLIVNKNNLGFAKANNLALSRARGKVILLINPDTVIQEDTLRVMLRFFEDNPDVGLAGCKVLNPDGTFQLACRRSFPSPWVAFTKIAGLSALFPKSKLFGKYNLTFLSPDETYEIDAVSGSFMMIRREVYDQVGGLDEEFFMYGEDLDWCYRIQKAGWKNYYVHTTQIIHYKGESTRRSSIDEIGTFYNAMHLYVRKHFHRSFLMGMMLRIGITLSSWFAVLKGSLRPLVVASADVVLVVGSLMLAEWIWLGQMFYFPSYAYPGVYTIPSVLIVGCLYSLGVYTHHRMSISRTLLGVVISYVLISALVAYFKNYAFSRMVILMSGGFAMLLLPGWRFVLHLIGRATSEGRRSIFGRRTLIVGADKAGRELLRRLRQRVGDGYEVLGFIDDDRKSVGEELDGVPIVGSLDNVGKVIQELRVNDVIFSTQHLSYSDILSVISRTREKTVSFHLVPNTLEVIIGKASVDSLHDLPLVQISYNIEGTFNRIAKRVFDVAVSSLLLISIYPFVYLKSALKVGTPSRFILMLPSVFSGTRSLVGPPDEIAQAISRNGNPQEMLNLGRPGLTGLVQMQKGRILTEKEREQYNLYYAKNQSLLLDLEILLKALFNRRSDRRQGTGGKAIEAGRQTRKHSPKEVV